MGTVPQKCAPSPNGEHCWHMALMQHAVTNHRDDTCCYCGVNRCMYVETGAHPLNHGPYLPGSPV